MLLSLSTGLSSWGEESRLQMFGLLGWLVVWYVYRRHPDVDKQSSLHSCSELVVAFPTRLLSAMRPMNGMLHVLVWALVEENWSSKKKRRDILFNFT